MIVMSDTQDAGLKVRRPMDFLHVEAENVLVVWIHPVSKKPSLPSVEMPGLHREESYKRGSFEEFLLVRQNPTKKN